VWPTAAPTFKDGPVLPPGDVPRMGRRVGGLGSS